MTADLRSMLQSEIYRCWSPPVGAPHPEKLIVSYELYPESATVPSHSRHN